MFTYTGLSTFESLFLSHPVQNVNREHCEEYNYQSNCVVRYAAILHEMLPTSEEAH